MHLYDYLDRADLVKSLGDGLVHESVHDELPLVLYSYTNKAMFEGTWSDATKKSRGLVVEDNGQIIGWCMPKFFSYGDHASGRACAGTLPAAEDFEIYAKVDGSMGTAFFYEDQWHVASKGSFHSEQAQWATEYIRKQFRFKENGIPMGFDPLNWHKTYVCEIIYPQNRIVVDYGSLEDLVLLAVFDNETGKECMTEERKLEWGWVGSIVQSFDPHGVSMDELQALADENIQFGDDDAYVTNDREVSGTESEGYVVRYESGIRCKVKLADYLRLHKKLTNCTERTIWESVRKGESLEALLDNVPDEFHKWVEFVVDGLSVAKDIMVIRWIELYDHVVSYNPGKNRKDFYTAIDILFQEEDKGALCLLWDGDFHKLDDMAWKLLYPPPSKPFRNDVDV